MSHKFNKTSLTNILKLKTFIIQEDYNIIKYKNKYFLK